MKKSTLVFFIALLSMFCSSCFTYKRITKSKTPLTKDIISKMVVGQQYKIQKTDQSKFIIRVKAIDSLTIYGEKLLTLQSGKVNVTPYQTSIDELILSTDKISKRKFNPLLSIGIPLSIFILFSIIIINSMTFSFQI